MIGDKHSPASVVRTWARLAAAALTAEREALNRVNVFPVADADTGTNLYLTVREGAHRVAAADPELGAAALMREFARGALVGARGNSGVILSEWLRGLSTAAQDGQGIEVALQAAATAARVAVVEPAVGTILTAADVAAEQAVAAAQAAGATVDEVLAAAVEGARAAALDSPRQMAALARAGVLDAGACGLVLILEALRLASEFERARAADPAPIAAASLGADADRPASAPPASVSELRRLRVDLGLSLTGHHGEGHIPGFGDDDHFLAGAPAVGGDEFEVMFTLTSAQPEGQDVAAAVRQRLQAVGKSVVVVGGGGTWQAHAHTEALADTLAAVDSLSADLLAVPFAQVRHLHPLPDGTVGEVSVVATTIAPTVAADLARAGVCVLLPVAGEVTPSDLAASALGGQAAGAIVLSADSVGVYAAGAALAQAYREEGEPEAELLLQHVTTVNDLETVVAVAALVTSAGDPLEDRLADALAALGGIVEFQGPAAVALEWLAARPLGPDCLVTALLGMEVTDSQRVELAAIAGGVGAELNPVETGAAGDHIELGVESGAAG